MGEVKKRLSRGSSALAQWSLSFSPPSFVSLLGPHSLPRSADHPPSTGQHLERLGRRNRDPGGLGTISPGWCGLLTRTLGDLGLPGWLSR